MKDNKILFTFLVLATLGTDGLPQRRPAGRRNLLARRRGTRHRRHRGSARHARPQLDADGAGSFEPADEWGMYTFTGDATSPTYSNRNIAYRAGNSNPLYWKDLSETKQ